ncbi:MAG: hypothetical protein KDB07_09160, partial [Planctomycetes bacterium]|nr:hypothetical protein [Planctomycetota bacterium]
MSETSEALTLIRPGRSSAPFVFTATIVAFLASGFFMVTTVMDVVGARDEEGELAAFRAPLETDSLPTFQHDLLIASIG